MRRWCVWTAVAATAAALIGCAGAPTPTWRLELRQAVEQASAASLEGRVRVADHHWRIAQQAASASGQARMLARVALLRCAVDLAALAWEGCPYAQPYLADATPAERVYAAYLGLSDAPVSDRDLGTHLELLPQAQREVARLLWGARAIPTDSGRAVLQDIPDPLSRLVAAGVLWRAGMLAPADVDLMVDTASAQGWRRPLVAWLTLQAVVAEQRAEPDKAAQVRRRLSWILSDRQPFGIPTGSRTAPVPLP